MPFHGFMLAASLLAPSVAPSDTSVWMRYFTGSWNCVGGFPSGRTLASTIRFAPAAGERFLQYTHDDLPPGGWHAQALWGLPAGETTLLSVLHDNGGGTRVYRADGWRNDELTWTRDTSALLPAGAKVPPADRFTFQRKSDSTFWFAWMRKGAGGAWAVGDSLTCRRG